MEFSTSAKFTDVFTACHAQLESLAFQRAPSDHFRKNVLLVTTTVLGVIQIVRTNKRAYEEFSSLRCQAMETIGRREQLFNSTWYKLTV